MRFAISIVAALIILPILRSLFLPTKPSNDWTPYNEGR
jgi:hypothetical protein